AARSFLPDVNRDRLAGVDGGAEASADFAEPRRIAFADGCHQHATDHAIGAEPVQDGPVKPCARSNLRVYVDRVVVAGEPVDQRRFRPAGDVVRLIRFPVGDWMRTGLLGRWSPAAAVAAQEIGCRPGGAEL